MATRRTGLKLSCAASLDQDPEAMPDTCTCTHGKKSGKMVAGGLCQDCNRYLCVECFHSHRKTRLRKYHVLIKRKTRQNRKQEEAAINDTRVISGQTCRASTRAKSNPDIGESSSKELGCISNGVTCNADSFIKRKVNDISIRLLEDKTDCFITGSVLLSPERLLLVDFHNEKLKLLHPAKNRIVSVLNICIENELYSGPWDVTAVKDTLVAVTSPNQNTIYIIEVNETDMTINRAIPVNGKCRGIAYKDDIFIVTFDIPTKIETINVEGEVLSSVDLRATGRFQRPSFVKLSADCQRIFVSDWIQQCIATVTTEGEITAKYTGEPVSLYNMCIGPMGHIYVCSFKQNSVHRLDLDLKSDTVILSESDGIERPVSVAWCRQNSKFYVGAMGNTVKVFQLK